MLYIPKAFAHGFQTLEDDTELFYRMSEFYAPECTSGVRWDGKTFGIQRRWVEERIISEKDLNYPFFGMEKDYGEL